MVFNNCKTIKINYLHIVLNIIYNLDSDAFPINDSPILKWF